MTNSRDGFSDIAKFVTRARRMKDVYRCAGTRMLRPYTLDSHGAFVAELYYLFARKEGLEVTAEQLFYILHHDILETETGDLLYPAKHASSEVESHWQEIETIIAERDIVLATFTDQEISFRFNDKEYSLFKVCDLVELWITVEEEIVSGNTSERILLMRRNIFRYLENQQFDSVREFMDTLE